MESHHDKIQTKTWGYEIRVDPGPQDKVFVVIQNIIKICALDNAICDGFYQNLYKKFISQ